MQELLRQVLGFGAGEAGMIVANISCALESPMVLQMATELVITGDAVVLQLNEGPWMLPLAPSSASPSLQVSASSLQI